MPQAFAIFALFFAASGAQAGFSCPGFAAFAEEVWYCDDNGVLGRAALNCVKSYKAHVKAAQADVLGKFQAQIARMKEAQNDSFDRTSGGYEDARKRLEALIEDGKAARAAVDNLYLYMAFPPDADEPETTGMSQEAYLASQECYAIPQRVMLQSQQMIDRMMSDLEATLESVTGKKDSSGSRSAKVQVLENNRGAAHTSAKGSGKAPAGRSRNPASDITGTEQQKKKDRESQRILEKKSP